MSISLTCTCGARLEIDDKFAGQIVPCPDCQKPLNTRIDEPKDPPVSALALGSLVLALVGGFTIIGSLAAVGLGYLALRQIMREPDKLGGLNFARAGMIVGGVFTLITAATFLSGEALGVDALLRQFRHASEVDYTSEPGGVYKITLGKDDLVGIQRPSRFWGKLKPLAGNQKDLLTLINLWEDAHLICLEVKEESVQAAREKIADLFRGSDLYQNLGKGRGKDPSPGAEAKPAADNKDDQTLDVRLGGYDRTFLLRVVKVGPDIYLLAGGARSHRFGRLTGEIRKSFDSFKRMEN
jgi:hypothetical protein